MMKVTINSASYIVDAFEEEEAVLLVLSSVDDYDCTLSELMKAETIVECELFDEVYELN